MSFSGIMETDMMASIKKTKSMAMVTKELFNLTFIGFHIFPNDNSGRIFWNNGSKYEGEWKDDKKHGHGKK